MSASTTYADVISNLRSAYDRSAAGRNLYEKAEWKLAERNAFLARLGVERKLRLLELGAGTGQDSLFFRQHGLDVVATDLSPEMVAMCRANGLDAHVMDVLNLTFPPGSFDAGYALNCLLHVPNMALEPVLGSIQRVLAPGALLYLGMYGGEDSEGYLESDWHRPKRFFSFRSDDNLLRTVQKHFELVEFHVVQEEGVRFQSVTVRRPDNALQLTCEAHAPER